MTYVILLLAGFVAGVLATAAFGATVKALIVGVLKSRWFSE